MLNKLKFEIKYLLSKPRIKKVLSSCPRVMSIEDTLTKIENGCSIVRFGDGELMFMAGKGLKNYQVADPRLAESLKRAIVSFDVQNLLICLPETMNDMRPFHSKTRKMWTTNLVYYYDTYRQYLSKEYHYGNAFVSRPYLLYKNKSNCKSWFDRLLNCFRGEDLLIVEGKYSRNGVGNDLFQNANSVWRIICPNINAYEKYDEILNAILVHAHNKLILLSVGPTSKPLAVELCKRGHRVIDIGHIDSEYEWYLSNAKERIKVKNKHTAEMSDEGIESCEDPEYSKSILDVIL